jgi:hypothetical protein
MRVEVLCVGDRFDGQQRRQGNGSNAHGTSLVRASRCREQQDIDRARDPDRGPD